MRSTAGKIFGAIGGVMEAAIRRALFLAHRQGIERTQGSGNARLGRQ